MTNFMMNPQKSLCNVIQYVVQYNVVQVCEKLLR